ncbi:MAG: segregation/condensation protein A [Bdellovibrionales bacterium]|nr:segregation/condensation protein A [Bdellovibrionales bacterium]
MGVVVHIDSFSGPLGLLLHLIRREEMDIFDININEITKQYLESIRAMKKLDLETAGDFIAMASTLLQIKSKMLLPQYNEEGEVLEEEDPRKDLVRRLLEYQNYQEASRNLYNRLLVGRDIWTRGSREEIQVADAGIILDEDNALYSLIASYRSAMKNVKKAVHKVANSLQSIADRIWQMRDRLVVGRTAKLSELIDSTTDRKGQLLITFLSLLELAKIGIVGLFQGDNFSDIHIETKREIDRDAISNVENYDSQISDVQGHQDIWLSEDDRKEDDRQMQIPVAQAPEEEEIIMTAATDEEIELEEKLYGQ